ncbi:MAG TPA: type II toxin-antitoxin system VapB family antitoxin [Arachnia sp.]|nr:type II toxin-antitoxin system VapB family antitoxin [Arachnia sp.]HMT86927.1 type II toxin-antitoxin system VapB family antitoxin [Arachnia sp.]
MTTMNIKDPKVHELAHELARLRGSSATAAVRVALEEALAHERRGKNLTERLARLQQRAATTQGDWAADDDLYDEHGLPR